MRVELSLQDILSSACDMNEEKWSKEHHNKPLKASIQVSIWIKSDLNLRYHKEVWFLCPLVESEGVVWSQKPSSDSLRLISLWKATLNIR